MRGRSEVAMALEFRFPDVGEGITEGEVVRWLVQEGETVRSDQPMVEVETDKAVVEIPAPQAGTILRLAVREGEKIHVGNVLVVIGEMGEQVAGQEPAAVEPTASPSVSVVGALTGKLTDLPPPPEAILRIESSAKTSRILAIPSVRKLARDHGIDLASVTPTGPHGRIRRQDVVQAAQSPALPAAKASTEQAPAVSQAQDDYGPIELLPVPALRRTIAEAMLRAASTAVPITTTDEVDVTDLVALRQRSKDAVVTQGIHVTLLPFIMKAVAAALREHSHLNATFADDQRHLILKRYYHLGIATDTPDGLIVPVIKSVDQKNIVTLAAELQGQTELARERRIPLADLRGGTFTISNYGAIGGIFATPMLNLPEVAILGIGKLLQKPTVCQGEVMVRTILPLSLTFDHRALDGATAQRFLNALMVYLSDPARLVLVL
ncbi:MAG: dihydrolipoamide acetyltransferase family protein [bacterium]|nr:dihydrolipoamide acetyltransferase family protein [bacterium]